MSDPSSAKSERTLLRRFTGGVTIVMALVFVPWAYFAFDRLSIADGRVDGFNGVRGLIAAGCFLAVAIPGVVLGAMVGLDPARLLTVAWPRLWDEVALFHLYAFGVFDSTTLSAFSAVDLAALVGVAAVASGLGYRHSTAAAVSRIREAARDHYVIPMSSVEAAREDDSYEVQLERSYSTLVMGTTGAGKSTTMKLLVRQLRQLDDDTAFVILDIKDEFQELFEDEDTNLSRDNLIRVSLDDSDRGWNLFEEIRNDHDYREIGSSIFDETDERYENQNTYFVTAAQDIFVAILRYLDAEEANPTNQRLVDFVTGQSYEELYETLSRHPDRDISIPAEDHLDPSMPEGQGKNVIGTLRTGIRKVFVGDFASVGSFSVTQYMNEPNGQVLLLDMPDTSRTAGPAFRFLIDRCLDMGVNDGSRHSLYVLDEFAQLPKLDNITTVTEVGRSNRTQAILGVQDITQVQDRYGEKKATTIVANMPQQILHQPGAGATETMEHMLEAVGEERETRPVSRPKRWNEFGVSDQKWETIVEDRNPFSKAEIRRFDQGEAIIVTRDGWVHGQICRPADLSNTVRRGLFGNGGETGSRTDQSQGQSANSNANGTSSSWGSSSWGSSSEEDAERSSESQDRRASREHTNTAGAGANGAGSKRTSGSGSRGARRSTRQSTGETSTGTADGSTSTNGDGSTERTDASGVSCPNCGAEFSSGARAKFCNNCWTDLTEETLE